MGSLPIEDDEEPFVVPDLPQYYSFERNKLSLVGRLLNPECQKIADFILEMPRKWQIYDKVRGVALTKEKFQFIFDYKNDLERVLRKGAHTFNQWLMLMKKSKLNPPSDYLDFMEVWAQIRNVSVNLYTEASITRFGEFAGQVVEVVFDPMKAQRRSYVRVKLRIEATQPLRRSKKISLPNGEEVSVQYDYERIQKRCYTCQRMIHDQTKCPFWNQKSSPGNSKSKEVKAPITKPKRIIQESDPLFRVLSEEQVCPHPLSGSSRIALDVLEGMRQYLLTANGPERVIREERVKLSLKSIEHDPIAEKTILRLEPPPIFTNQLDKGKGLVFDFQVKSLRMESLEAQNNSPKLMAAAFKVGGTVNLESQLMSKTLRELVSSEVEKEAYPKLNSSTFRIGSAEPGPLGTRPRNKYSKRKSYSSNSKSKG